MDTPIGMLGPRRCPVKELAFLTTIRIAAILPTIVLLLSCTNAPILVEGEGRDTAMLRLGKSGCQRGGDSYYCLIVGRSPWWEGWTKSDDFESVKVVVRLPTNEGRIEFHESGGGQGYVFLSSYRPYASGRVKEGWIELKRIDSALKIRGNMKVELLLGRGSNSEGSHRILIHRIEFRDANLVEDLDLRKALTEVGLKDELDLSTWNKALEAANR